MELKAYGKINPALNVGPVREDGFHEVCIVMQQVDLYDIVTVDALDQVKDSAEVIFTCTKDLGIPDEKNLAVKAARKMQERYHLPSVKIHLEKNLPAAAGMAGGSTDAAAVLKAMKELFLPELPMEELLAIGAELGSDVPYCIVGGTALCTGRGEIVRPLPDLPSVYLLVFKPSFGISTPWSYQHFKEGDPMNPPADMEAMLKALKEKDLSSFVKEMRNQLYQPAVEAHPELEDMIHSMEEMGAMKAMMTGSGPTVFGFFDREDQRDQAAKGFDQAMKEKGIEGTLLLAKTLEGEYD